MDRRTFLARLGSAGVAGVAGTILGARGTSSASLERPPLSKIAKSTDHLVTADWVKEENARSDRTSAWIIPRRLSGSAPPAIEGYLNKVSVAPGDELILRVNTVASSYRAFVYRIGYYDGFGARPIVSSPVLTGHRQAAPSRTPGVNTIECNWSTSWTTPVTKEWPTGQYLIKLVGSGNEQQYVPFTVRDDASASAYVVQSSVTTWQAYNAFGGYSLYGGPVTPTRTSFQNRARIVSFNRPYRHSPLALDYRGSGDLLGNELPMIYLAERHGLDVSYITDVDLHANPSRLLRHRAFLSLGHDEYWSMQMRDGALAARDRGVNLAFFGANACYRQVRFASSSDGEENRHLICYKDAAEDPVTDVHPGFATAGSWATGPIPRPESDLIGLMYQSFGAPFGPLTVTDGSSWIFGGTGLSTGEKIPDVIGSEFDGFEPGLPHPDNIEILGHSPTSSSSGARHADLSYYSSGTGNGGVFASGTASWVASIWDGSRRTQKLLGFGNKAGATLAPLTAITLNVLAAFGPGPAGERHRSRSNWRQFYKSNQQPHASKDV